MRDAGSRSAKKDKRKVVAEVADFVHDLFGGLYDTALDKTNIKDHKEPASVDWSTGTVCALESNPRVL